MSTPAGVAFEFIIHAKLRLGARILAAECGSGKLIDGDNYTMLMKYLSFISIPRNQRQLLRAGKAFPARPVQPDFLPAT